MENERLKILKMVEVGQIDAAEAAMLLATLDEAVSEEPSRAEEVLESSLRDPVPVESAENRWARFWIYPLLGGGAVLIAGVLVMALVYAAHGAGVWLCCGWLPMLLGAVTLILALWSRRATWMHLRISKESKRKMAFSFPLPLSLGALAVRIAQPFVPQLRDTGVDDLILALRESSSRGEPLFIDVQDDQDGERVELYIG